MATSGAVFAAMQGPADVATWMFVVHFLLQQSEADAFAACAVHLMRRVMAEAGLHAPLSFTGMLVVCCSKWRLRAPACRMLEGYGNAVVA